MENKTITLTARIAVTDKQWFDDYCKQHPNKETAFATLRALATAEPTTQTIEVPVEVIKETVNEVLVNVPTPIELTPNELIITFDDNVKVITRKLRPTMVNDGYLKKYATNNTEDFYNCLVNQSIKHALLDDYSGLLRQIEKRHGEKF